MQTSHRPSRHTGEGQCPDECCTGSRPSVTPALSIAGQRKYIRRAPEVSKDRQSLECRIERYVAGRLRTVW